MKKILTLMLVFTLFISIFTGCKQENTANVVAKNLDSNLNKLEVAVNKLDTVDNKYLSNPDIYSSLTGSPSSNNGKYFALAFNNNSSTQPVSNIDTVKQVLIDKITDKLLQQNTTPNSDNCYNCKKYCDENGNCYYTDCNGNNYCYGINGECYSCNSIPSNCSYMGETTLTCPGSTTTISETNNDELVATNLTQTIETEEIDNLEVNNTENNEVIEPSVEESPIQENQENISELPTPSKPKVKVYYFTQDSFAPIKLKYNPRYISQFNENTINEQIESYLFKVQKLYAMSEDSIEANTILNNCKQNIIDCIKEIRELNNCIINGKCEPSVQELQALNNYIVDIKTTTNRLKDCNGELSKEINKISEANNNVMINSVDVMNSNYMRLLNHIDTRVTYHKSAIATLEQIRYLLEGAINGNNITDEEFETIIEDLTIEKTPSSEVENNSNTVVTETETEENLDNKTTVDDSPSEDIVTEDTTEEVIENTTTNDTIITNNDSTNVDGNQDLENNTIEEDTNTQNTTDEVVNENNVDNTTIEEVADNNTIEETTNSSEVVEETVGEKNTLIDTYKETNSWSNVDTYKSTEDIVETENNILTTEENVNNEIVSNENIDNEVNDNNTVNNDNTIVDTNNTNDTIVKNTDNNVSNNGLNDSIVNQGTSINNNSGVYKNSVITQNNLDTNNGYGGYYYTNDGEIKNNGMNNDNEIGNNGETLETNLNSKNNVNTYGYNTMLDIINQGTVNNGINTL